MLRARRGQALKEKQDAGEWQAWTRTMEQQKDSHPGMSPLKPYGSLSQPQPQERCVAWAISQPCPETVIALRSNKFITAIN